MRTASQLFTKSHRKGFSTYALAWAGLAETTALQHQYGDESGSVVLPKAKQQVRGLSNWIRDGRGAIYSGVGRALLHEWADAEQALRKAIALNPRYASAHHWYAAVLSNQGRHAEAYVEIDRLYRLDPSSPHHNNVGVTRFFAGDFDGAIEAFPKDAGHLTGLSRPWLSRRVVRGAAAIRRAEAEYARCTMPGYSERGRG